MPCDFESSFQNTGAKYGTNSVSESGMAPVFWNKIEERLFRGAKVVTIYVSFLEVVLVECSSILCVAPQEDERTGNDSRIENFRLGFLIQPPKVR